MQPSADDQRLIDIDSCMKAAFARCKGEEFRVREVDRNTKMLAIVAEMADD